MTVNEAINYLEDAKIKFKIPKAMVTARKTNEALDMAINSLEMQKALSEYSRMDICKWVEDYDYEENNISEYEYEANVDDFLIDETREEVKKNDE